MFAAIYHVIKLMKFRTV